MFACEILTSSPPPEDLLPYGGENVPTGHYNWNDDKYSQFFAFGYTPWSAIIDTEVENPMDLSLPSILAEILWELTFYGWSEKEHQERINSFKTIMEQAFQTISSENN